MLAIQVCPREAAQCVLCVTKVQVLNFVRKGEDPYAEVAELCGDDKSSACETVKQEREVRASLAVTPRTGS